MNDSSKNIVLVLLIGCLIYHSYNKNNIDIPNNKPNVVVPNIPDKPNKPVVPKPVVPYDNSILYDDYQKAISLSKQYDRKVLLVFGADWCPYCRDIKRDAKSNKIDSFKYYIVCFIDTDKNGKLASEFRIKGLPTSVIIDSSEKELARKSGYRNSDYNEWLKNSTQDGFMSWIDSN